MSRDETSLLLFTLDILLLSPANQYAEVRTATSDT